MLTIIVLQYSYPYADSTAGGSGIIDLVTLRRTLLPLPPQPPVPSRENSESTLMLLC